MSIKDLQTAISSDGMGALDMLTSGSAENTLLRKRAAERQEQLSDIAATSQTPIASTLVSILGRSLGKGLLSKLGIEDPELERARVTDQLAEVMASIDLNTVEGRMQAANIYQRIGDQTSALSLLNSAKTLQEEINERGAVQEPSESQLKRIKNWLVATHLNKPPTDANDKAMVDALVSNMALLENRRRADSRVKGLNENTITPTQYMQQTLLALTDPNSPERQFDVDLANQGGDKFLIKNISNFVNNPASQSFKRAQEQAEQLVEQQAEQKEQQERENLSAQQQLNMGATGLGQEEPLPDFQPLPASPQEDPIADIVSQVPRGNEQGLLNQLGSIDYGNQLDLLLSVPRQTIQNIVGGVRDIGTLSPEQKQRAREEVLRNR
jgi:hypothetical protein